MLIGTEERNKRIRTYDGRTSCDEIAECVF
jgi:hypothetical protein